MIGVVFDPSKLKDTDEEWWTRWQKRANDATGDAIDAFEFWLGGDRKKPFQFSFNSDIWRDLKNWLMKNVFYRKCAYCERIISGAHGDAEHYRPKGAVKYKDGAADAFLAHHSQSPYAATVRSLNSASP